MARAKNLKFTVLPSSLAIRTDPNLLRRVVQNLVSNAIKYTTSGKVLVGVRRTGGHAFIQVLDSGIGIPASKFRTVFKEFARLDEGARTAPGLELGLSIVDRISRVLSHPVELQSTPGRGTSFKVRVPVDVAASRHVADKPAAVPVSDEPLRGLRVLCIDNEPKILDGMRLLLSGWGCAVTLAESVAAVEALAAAEPPAIDAVIADYHLDDGTGIAAISRLRAAACREIPALLVTADRTPDVRVEAERDNILVQNKPVRPASMRAWLTQFSAMERTAAE